MYCTKLARIAASSAIRSQSAPAAVVTEYIARPEFLPASSYGTSSFDAVNDALEQDTDEAGGGRRSQAAQDGSSRIGMIQLPTELQLAVSGIIQDTDKQLLRQRALAIYEWFRKTSDEPSPANRVKGDKHYAGYQKLPPKPFLDGATAVAYTAGVMPSIYGSTLAALLEARQRLDTSAIQAGVTPWLPRKIVDWGSGVGSVGWAAHQTWSEDPISYVGLDSSRAMQVLSSNILKAIPSPTFQRKLVQTSLAAPNLNTAITAAFPDIPSSETMAIAAFTLGDIPSEKSRREVVRSIWNTGAEVIVLIDRGTPKGADIIAQARDQLLRLGRHSTSRSDTSVNEAVLPIDESSIVVNEDETEIRIGDEIFVLQESDHDGQEEYNEPDLHASRSDENASQQAGPTQSGCYVVAPCPHEKSCPLHKTRDFCHFTQKLQRPAFLRKTKHSSTNEETASYSYVVIKRGDRPTSESLWPRLVVPPLKRGGHVILDACCPNGNIERVTVPKSAGKQEYYDARKSRWGDSFPHWDASRSIVKTSGLSRTS